MRCEQCKRTFPESVISNVEIGDETGLRSILCCALCALKIRNEIHGLGTEPFSGQSARRLFNEARKYLEKTAPEKLTDFEKKIPE